MSTDTDQTPTVDVPDRLLRIAKQALQSKNPKVWKRLSGEAQDVADGSPLADVLLMRALSLAAEQLDREAHEDAMRAAAMHGAVAAGQYRAARRHADKLNRRW